jgi:hypothetical protein
MASMTPRVLDAFTARRPVSVEARAALEGMLGQR